MYCLPTAVVHLQSGHGSLWGGVGKSCLPSEWLPERQRLHVVVRREPERECIVEHDAPGTKHGIPFTRRAVDAEVEAGGSSCRDDLSSFGQVTGGAVIPL